MTERREDEQVATYEVSLRGAMPASLRHDCPAMDVHSAPAQTVFYRAVQDVGELDELLDRVRATGLVLTEVHATAVADGAAPPLADGETATARGYEVRVRGELGANLLGYLGWAYRLVAERQVARGAVSAGELCTFLSHCSESGLTVDRVRRVAPG